LYDTQVAVFPLSMYTSFCPLVNLYLGQVPCQIAKTFDNQGLLETLPAKADMHCAGFRMVNLGRAIKKALSLSGKSTLYLIFIYLLIKAGSADTQQLGRLGAVAVGLPDGV